LQCRQNARYDRGWFGQITGCKDGIHMRDQNRRTIAAPATVIGDPSQNRIIIDEGSVKWIPTSRLESRGY
jgi:hypothetical protein